MAALVRATQAFADSCFAAKCAEKVLDYADYEHLTLDLLLTESNERTPLCATVSARYAAVLVDEYQDTNALQDAIYFALARPEADNLFFVGDIKQSIYRFRLADPGIFVDKQQRWQPHPQPAPLPSTLALDANFRSAPGVIAGINYLFETFFSRGLGGVDYGDGQRLVVGGDKDAAYQGMCEIDVIDGADVDGDAAVIARRIAEMVGQGFPCAARTARGPAGTMTSAFCCAGARALRPTRVRCAPRASRCLRTPPPTCWTSRTSARLRRCCASSTTLRRTSRWRRCC
ncbi:UvrD-helicase domain-containing protein [Gemmiger formicilis]|nr:UvrD-helicase domain-containing protein [Gemmiger formicilis]